MPNVFHKDFVGDELHIARTQVSTGDPNSVVTAGIIGEFYWDSDANKLYVAEALTNSNWVNEASSSDTLAEILAVGNTSGGNDIVMSANDNISLLGGVIDFAEIATPANPAADTGRLYVEDVAGTTSLFFRDSAGAAKNILLDAPGGSDTEVQFNNSGVLDGITGVTTSGSNLEFADNTSLILGDSSDMVIFHSGTFSRITNNIGNLELVNGTGGDLILDSTGVTNGIFARLGTDTNATSFDVRNDSNNNLLTVEGDGDVGIGVTPTARLHVKQDVDGFPIMRVDNLSSGTAAAASLELTADGGSLFLSAFSSGFTPAQAMFPDGAELKADTSLTAGLSIVAENAAGTIRFYSGGANEQMRIDAAGNVGIGTVAPDSRLHVHEATAGSVAAPTNTVLTVENSTDSLIAILSPDASDSGISFGSPGRQIGAAIDWNFSNNLLNIAALGGGTTGAAVNINAGSGTSTGGTTTITSGAGAGGSAVSGPTNIRTANAAGNNTAGAINITAGAGGNTGTGGAVNITGGDGGTIVGSGGRVILEGGESDLLVIANVVLQPTSGNVGIGTLTPDGDSLLQLDSTISGFLMPRMTTTQRDAIPSPLEGLEIYNTSTSEPEFFNGTIWVNTGSTAPGGLDTEVQFNNAGVFGGITGVTTSGTNLELSDSVQLEFGTGTDTIMRHDGNDMRLTNTTGDLIFVENAGSDDILLLNQGASGNIITRLGTATTATSFRVQDSAVVDLMIVLGDGDVGIGTITPDSRLHVHNGSAGAVSAPSGTVLTIENQNQKVLNLFRWWFRYRGSI